MDSAFAVGDRMAMLDKGHLIAVDTRQRFEAWRDTPKDQAASLTLEEQLIRQFLRGDPEGPLSRRRAAKSYEDDLLGATTFRESTPSVEPTR
jgi:ABC-type transporter Mla maintaining outer membrane lipid asymmetry ATPase subunit MlaF